MIDEKFRGALRAKNAAHFLDLSISTCWRHVSEGRSPHGIKLSPRATVWPVGDLQKLLERENSDTRGKDDVCRGVK